MEMKDRKNTRFTANFDGLYRLRNQYEWLECYIYDISETGALIKMNQTLLKDDIVEICLDLEQKSDVIIGVVANIKGQVAGIHFTTKNINSIVNKAIERAFLKARKGKKGLRISTKLY